MSNPGSVPATDPDLGPTGPAAEGAGADGAGAQDSSLEKVRELISRHDECMLTTIGREGHLVARPMALQQAEFDGDLWFLADAESHKVEEIGDGARANAAFSGHGAWVSVAGTAEVVRDVAKKKELWGTFTGLWFSDRDPEDPSVVLVRLSGETAEYWAADRGPKMLVELAKSAVKRERPDLGDNATVEL